MGIKALGLIVLLPLAACDCDGGGLHQKKADIAVSPNPLVFDTVPRQTTASREVIVSNPGDDRLDVTALVLEAGGSAGFALPDTASFAVEPGATHAVEVRFTAGDLEDAQGTLLLQSNADGQAETRVTLEATRRQGPVLVICVESADVPLALDCGSPSAIDFGRVRLDEERKAVVTLRSEGTDPVSISAVSLAGHPSFAIDAPVVPATLAVGDRLEIGVRFTASVQEAVAGTLSIASNDTVTPNPQVALQGQGAEIGLCIEPEILRFGSVRAGASSERSVRLTNCGSAAFDLTGAEVYLDAEEFALVGGIASPITLTPQSGLNFELTLRYTPLDEGDDEGRLRITTSNGTALVALTGDSRPCSIAVTPAALSFQYDPARPPETKNVLVENAGTSSCTVESIEITEGADGGFQLAGDIPDPLGGGTLPVLPAVLESGESITVPVGFWPRTIVSSTVSGTLEIAVAELPTARTVDLLATLDFVSVCDSDGQPDHALVRLARRGRATDPGRSAHQRRPGRLPPGLDRARGRRRRHLHPRGFSAHRRQR